MNKSVKKYTGMYRKTLRKEGYSDIEKKTSSFEGRLNEMYASDAYRQHNRYPTMNVELIYAVIAMCLELKDIGLSDKQIIDFSDKVFRQRRMVFSVLTKCLVVLPNAYRIVEKWNMNDHKNRVQDGSLTYDSFEVKEGKIEYRISHCMYAELFQYYGIRPLCKIFCLTDEAVYANLTRHVLFIRHSDLSEGDCCHDEVINKQNRMIPRLDETHDQRR